MSEWDEFGPAVEMRPEFTERLTRTVDAALAERRRQLRRRQLRRRGRTLNVGRWRWHFWRGPTKLGVHRSLPGAGAAGLGLFGVNWVRRSAPRDRKRERRDER